MRIAEDTEFLKRLPPHLEPVWEPEVKTIHRNETRLSGLLFDQYRRGYRSGTYCTEATQAKPFHLARNNFRDRRQIRKLARVGLSGPELSLAMRSMPIVLSALSARSLGIYMGARDRLKNVRKVKG